MRGSQQSAVSSQQSGVSRQQAAVSSQESAPLRVDEHTLVALPEGSVVVFNFPTLAGDHHAVRCVQHFAGNHSGRTYTCRWLGLCELKLVIEPVSLDEAERRIEAGEAR